MCEGALRPMESKPLRIKEILGIMRTLEMALELYNESNAPIADLDVLKRVLLECIKRLEATPKPT